MTITERVKIPDRQAFNAGLARRDSLVEKAKFVAAYMEWDSVPGFAQCKTRIAGGCSVSPPLFDDCTVVLLHGQMQLDDDERTFTGTNVAVRVQGSKKLKIIDNSAAVWYPAPRCFNVENCHFAAQGQCRRLGIGNVREVKKVKRSWWRRFTGLGRTSRAATLDAVYNSK
ncbi:hypothetical protein F5Y06DRAFT_298197 [Hypoxylon sp. FL0890]|nr:hypothetical protein F5Y06DRAFT_298197 [Hypoxylon sp. FL0890]